NHHPHPVINKQPPADPSSSVNLNPSQKPPHLRNHPPNKIQLTLLKSIRNTITPNPINPSIPYHYFNIPSTTTIFIKHTINIFFHHFQKHILPPFFPINLSYHLLSFFHK
ncbi:hypothetical protein, partial [Bacillus altitudinis]|uniref:hypothetical protein n=1 Tax=Bacillus altitudinis TaxID=293387 RepID=UPI001C92DB6E